MKRYPARPLRSVVDGVAWPALPGAEARDLLGQLYQLEQTEWCSPEVLEQRQLEQFALLARHAREQSDFYRDRFERAGAEREQVWDVSRFRSLPLLTRRDLLTRARAIDCRAVPKSHGPAKAIQTSGSTGEIVSVRRTVVNQLMWLALTMRDHLWHGRDFRQPLAVVRANAAAQDDDDLARRYGWGPPVSMLYASGPSYALPLGTPLERQLEWLLRRDPGYLLTYPTNLAALLELFEASGQKLANLRELRSVGETLTPELRERCRRVLGVPVVDNYSSQEVGIIALECPVSGLYHVQAESLIVEVVADDGRPCGAGEVGSVVVTDLHNFATPLIRYAIRDRARVGSACPCGRGLLTLERVLGRERNMVVLPNGERRWPLVGLHRYREVAPILQYQLIQHDLERLEMRLVTGAGALGVALEERLSAIVNEALGHRFRIEFRYFDGELPRGAGGKFEEFVCLVSGTGASAT